jgi:hypothetical protein
MRWHERRRKHGWRAAAVSQQDNDGAHVNNLVRPWADLPAGQRERAEESVRFQLVQLEAVGYMPIVAENGPADATVFRRIGEVLAKQLTAGWGCCGQERGEPRPG